MTSILGISAFYHDSAAALIIDGNIIAAAQEERFSRKKHDPRYPYNAVKYILEESNLNTVLLLNPKNEEAIYLLTLLNIKNSNFSTAKELIVKLNLVCEKMCSSKLELQKKLDSSLKSK